MKRLALLPRVFVAGHRQVPPPTPYVSGRALRAAIAANAALMTFAGDDEATRAPGGHDPFAAPAAPAAPADKRVSAPAAARNAASDKRVSAPAPACNAGPADERVSAPAAARNAAPADERVSAPAQPPVSAPDRAA